MTIEIIILIILAAFVCEFIDASMGMLYGTILSPVLIIAGFEPILVIPSILFSQALGGFTASIFHNKFKNVDLALKVKNPRIAIKKLSELGFIKSFQRGASKDFKISFAVVILGIIAIFIAVIITINVPKVFLKTYIGTLILVMGVILIVKPKFKFSWNKILAVGVLSAFNKGMSGGGFGPVVTSGQMIVGREGKSSIGVTTFTEAPICIVGFLTFWGTKGISDWNLILFLSIGAIVAAPLGAFLTSKFRSGESEQKLKIGLGALTLFLGIWTIAKTWLL